MLIPKSQQRTSQLVLPNHLLSQSGAAKSRVKGNNGMTGVWVSEVQLAWGPPARPSTQPQARLLREDSVTGLWVSMKNLPKLFPPG